MAMTAVAAVRLSFDPMWIKRAATSLHLRGLDLRDRISGRADRLVPPRRLDFVGGRDFVATGNEFFAYLREHGAVGPTSRVLDVGCGIGRMARPLASYLSSQGSYNGFDVNANGIRWCRHHYAQYSHFRFQLVDLYNGRY